MDSEFEFSNSSRNISGQLSQNGFSDIDWIQDSCFFSLLNSVVLISLHFSWHPKSVSIEILFPLSPISFYGYFSLITLQMLYRVVMESSCNFIYLFMKFTLFIYDK